MRVDRVLAPNPGIFTGPGTNTYVVGGDSGVVVIDPGPIERSHELAIIEAAGRRPVKAVIVTHTHVDHAPLANPLAKALGVEAIGHSPGPLFDPDRRVVEGDVIECDDWALSVLHTPGHSEDHICLQVGRILFTGDHIMGGSSVMIDDLAPYLASLRRLQNVDLERLYPGHGPEIEQPQEVISWYLAHRIQREQEIFEAVLAGAATIEEVVEIVYLQVDRSLHALAARSVSAHLRKLATDGRVALEGSRIRLPG